MSSLIHELVLLQEREGWLSEASLRTLAEKLGLPLHRLESVSTFYTHFERTPPRGKRIDVCRDLSCALAGGSEARAKLVDRLAGRDDVEIREVSCLGRCERAPAAAIGNRALSLERAEDVLEALEGREPREPPAADRSWEQARLYTRADQRFETLRAALRGDPAQLAGTLEEAGLRGMGGAGFPTGRKWSLVRAEPERPKYVICNADESEPGTFKDREILQQLPHLVLEGMALAGLCVGAERGYVFIRHEYAPERRGLQQALEEANASGALGSGIFGSEFRFEIEIFVSPGGYILGEETALLECMEGRRGEPRNRPPFPGSAGLHGKPTLINNVETLVHATAILRHGAAWWRSLGRPGFAGHKFLSVSGDVARPGVFLVPFGTTLGELLERCGGMREGKALAAVAPGGASSPFLRPDALPVPIDFASLEKAGSILGSGAVVFIAKGRDLREVGLNVARFFRNESCGKCVPCRVGTEKAVDLVEAEQLVSEQTQELLAEMHHTLLRTSLCGLGQVALSPLLSLLAFPSERGRE